MADFVDSTVQGIDRRLKELKAEVAKLEAARAALVGGAGAPSRQGPRAASSSGATRRRRSRGPGRPRGRSGGNTRGTQALELVRRRPGITIPQIATELKIEPNYLYRVMPKLVDAGQVRTDGRGYHPA